MKKRKINCEKLEMAAYDRTIMDNGCILHCPGMKLLPNVSLVGSSSHRFAEGYLPDSNNARRRADSNNLSVQYLLISYFPLMIILKRFVLLVKVSRRH